MDSLYTYFDYELPNEQRLLLPVLAKLWITSNLLKIRELSKFVLNNFHFTLNYYDYIFPIRGVYCDQLIVVGIVSYKFN